MTAMDPVAALTAMRQHETLLELRGVKAAYGTIEVLHGIDFALEKGSITALLGANGAGKTTTLRAVSGLVRPTSGTVTFAGARIDGRRASSVSRMGLVHVPEGRGIFPSLSVRANLQMAAYGMPGDAGIDAAVQRFPVLGSRMDQLAGTLSGGEQQMLAMARALSVRPRLLLLDEISMGLAPLIVAKLFEEVRALAEAGVTILLVEQYVNTALGMADYAYVLDKGRVVDVGEPGDLQADGVVSSYLGG